MSETRPFRVLVVCTGNTCRTPLAEALLRRLFDEAGIAAEVASAGTHAWDGAPAHPESSAVATAAGLDVSGHRARLLTEELVRWADLVIGMSPGHVRRAADLDPTAECRVITEFAPDGPHREGIMDPIGWDRDVYENVFREIETCLQAFVDRHASRSPSGGA